MIFVLQTIKDNHGDMTDIASKHLTTSYTAQYAATLSQLVELELRGSPMIKARFLDVRRRMSGYSGGKDDDAARHEGRLTTLRLV